MVQLNKEQGPNNLEELQNRRSIINANILKNNDDSYKYTMEKQEVRKRIDSIDLKLIQIGTEEEKNMLRSEK